MPVMDYLAETGRIQRGIISEKPISSRWLNAKDT